MKEIPQPTAHQLTRDAVKHMGDLSTSVFALRRLVELLEGQRINLREQIKLLEENLCYWKMVSTALILCNLLCIGITWWLHGLFH